MRPAVTILICAALASIACSKEAEESPVCLDLRSITVQASIPATKLASDRGKMTWTEGDAIAVYNTSGDKFDLSLSEGAGTNSGKFTGSISGTLDTRFAVHPAAFAGSRAGTVSLPSYVEYSDNVPAVMASPLELSGDQINAVHFSHLMSIMAFTLKDLPAYARAFKLESATGAQLTGDFTIKSSADGVSFSTGGPADSRIIYFPPKTAYGPDATVELYFPVPAYDFTDLKVQVLDGDGDPLEGCDIPVPPASASLKVGDFVQMPALNIRALTGASRSEFVKVHGTKWARGNLLRDQSVSRDNWVPGWGIHSNQWDFKSGSDTQSYYDHFNWGGISAASYQTDSVSVYPNKGVASGTLVAYFTYIWPRGAALDFQGRLFRYWDGTGERAFDYSLLDGTGKGAPYFFYSGNNDGTTHPKEWATNGTPASVKTFSSYYGDLVFWASKGQYMMPGPSDFEALVNNANQQAGYYEASGQRIYGILFTTCGEWQARTIDLSFRKLDEGDMESGLFLPLAGYRKPSAERAVETKAVLANWTPASSEITDGGTTGAYWSSAMAASGVQSHRPQMLYMHSDGSSVGRPIFGDSVSSESITVSSSRTCNLFGPPAGLSVRPVYLATIPSEPTVDPPTPEASGNGFPALWEITSGFYGSASSPTAAGKEWIDNGRAIATNRSSTTGTAFIATSRTKASGSLKHTINSDGCPAIGGLDEGDCIEFCSPVESIPAGTDFDLMLTVNANNKALPKYWLLEYWEDGEWKSGDAPYTATEDPSVKYSCTILRPASSCYRTLILSFTLHKAVTNDFVKVRLRAVGKINGNGATLTPSSEAQLYYAPLTYEAVRFIAYPDAPAVKDTKKLLVLGNSFTYYFGSAFLLKELARKEGHQLEIRINLKGSQHYYNHLYGLEYSQEAINEGGYDFALLQDGTYFAAEYAYGDASVVTGGAAYTPAQILQYTKEMNAAVRASSPNAQIMYELCKSSPTKAGDFYGFGSYDAYDELQLTGAFALAEADPNINWISPVGTAVRNARNNYGYSSGYNYLNYTDNAHPSRECQYLKACTSYLIMYGQDFGSAPATCGIAAADATKLRSAAKDIALNDRNTYHIR